MDTLELANLETEPKVIINLIIKDVNVTDSNIK